MADACVGALADGGVLVWVVADATVDGSETGTSFRQALGFMERGMRLHDTMIWQKAFGNPGIQARYIQAFEYMFVFSNGSPSVFQPIKDRPNVQAPRKTKEDSSGRANGDQKRRDNRTIHRDAIGYRTNVWRYHTGVESDIQGDHPAIFPLALAKDHITTWTNPGDAVLDPMAGSGTVLRAAKDLGRVAVGVEIHEDYLPIITGRMAQSVLALA